MAMIAARIKHYLENYKISYHVFRHPRTKTLHEAALALNIPEAQFARAVVLNDKAGALLAVLPLNTIIDFEKLKSITGRDLSILSKTEMDNIYSDCEPCSHAPLGEPYGLPMIVDKRLANRSDIYFEAGCHNSLVRMNKDDFFFLTSKAMWGHFAETLIEPRLVEAQSRNLIWDKIDKVYVLPDCPNLSSASPDVLKSVLNTLFTPDQTGPLGAEKFWQHAMLCANLARQLASEASPSLKLDLDLAYLAGWMHNVGFLVLGHFFKPEFRVLNKLLQIYPDAKIQDLEQKLLGMGSAQQVVSLGHTQMGAWLLNRWRMPKAVIAVCLHHHQAAYRGEHWPYVQLVFLADQLLSSAGIGEGGCLTLKSSDFNVLGLMPERVNTVFEQILAGDESCLDESVTLMWSK